jgi:zinc D-Ala-D-Ala carboxypeptidase
MSEQQNWPHFTKEELCCKCGCGACEMDPVFMTRLEVIRRRINLPMFLSSAYRCEEHNRKVSKSRHGAHVVGRAVDVIMFGYDAYELMRLAFDTGMTGIGVNQNGPHRKRFIHIDDVQQRVGRPRPWVWSYA